jgi:hypothetical protein
MEGSMLKRILICVAFSILGGTPTNAQRQEAVLQRIGLPGAGVDILLATPKSPAATIDLSESPEALIVPLVGNALTLVFEDGAEMLAALEPLRYPGCSFLMSSKDGKSTKPVSVYFLPAQDSPAKTQSRAP